MNMTIQEEIQLDAIELFKGITSQTNLEYIWLIQDSRIQVDVSYNGTAEIDMVVKFKTLFQEAKNSAKAAQTDKAETAKQTHFDNSAIAAITLAHHESCTCGGSAPNKGCPACDMWHRLFPF